MSRGGDVGRHGSSAVERLVQPDAGHVDDLGVVGIDPDLAEIHRAGVGVVHLLPRRAAVVGTVEAGRLGVGSLGATAALPSRAACRSAFGLRSRPLGGCCGGAPSAPAGGGDGAFNRRVENVRPLAGDVERDAAQRRLIENTALDARPRLAAVGRLPDTAARAAAVHAARRPPPLVRRRINDLAVRRIDHQLVRAGVVVDLEHVLPGLASVGRLEHAAFAARAPQAAGGRNQHHVGVARIDGDAVDVLRRAKAHVRVGLAAVGRLVDAVAPRGALPVVRLPGAYPDEVWIALGDGDVTDRHVALVL